MATSLSDLLTEVSNELDDATRIVWAESATLVPFARDGVRLIRARRADARFDDSGNYVDDADATVASASDVPLPESFVSRLKLYILARCYMRDAADARDVERGQLYMNQFFEELRA